MRPEFSSFLMLGLVLGFGDVHCEMIERERRSDDTPALETVVNSLSQKLTQLTAQFTALQNKHDQLQAKFDASQKQVSFLARHSSDPFNVASAGTVVYNHADINVGGGYDTTSGIFTAPVSGLYVFYINCMAVTSVIDEDAGVLVEGTRVSGCYSYSNGYAASGSGLAPVHMNAGQRAWVHLYRDSGRDVRGFYWNTFVGYLVTADD